MKNSILLLISIILISVSGCGGKKEVPDKPASDSLKNNTAGTTGNDKKQETQVTETANTGKISDIMYDIKDYLKTLIFEGKYISGVQWKDKNGQNVIVLSESEVKVKKGKSQYDSDKKSKQLYGYHFLIKEGNAEELWKVQDFVNDCEFDLTLEHLKKSLTVTDLDSNGIAESTFLYRLTCRSDVSPCDMKLIMHEGKEKYALRGEMEITFENGDNFGGKMNTDKSFDKAPAAFLKYAKKQWEQFKNDKFD
jgi:hypothetical protein